LFLADIILSKAFFLGEIGPLAPDLHHFALKGWEYAMTQEKLRECARRQNRAVSLFCIVQCWLHGWDGITIRRDCFKQFFGLQKFKNSRLEWISADLKEFFPHHKPEHLSAYFDSVKISRFPFELNPHIGEFKIWEHPSKEYLVKFCEEFLPLFADNATYDDRLLAFYLSWLATKQISSQ